MKWMTILSTTGFTTVNLSNVEWYRADEDRLVMEIRMVSGKTDTYQYETETELRDAGSIFADKIADKS